MYVSDIGALQGFILYIIIYIRCRTEYDRIHGAKLANVLFWISKSETSNGVWAKHVHRPQPDVSVL